MGVLIQATEVGMHIGDAPGAYKVLMFASADFDPTSGKPAAASIAIPFSEEGWRAFQAMVADNTSRIVPVGPGAMAKLPPLMAVPQGQQRR